MLRYLLWAAAGALLVFGPGFITAGVWLVAGMGWAFIVLGALYVAAAVFALLADLVPDRDGAVS